MRIDDTDPDEADDRIESRRRRRRVLTIASIVVVVLGTAAVVVAQVAGPSDPPAAEMAGTLPQTVTTDTVAEEPEVPFQPQGPNEFPDFGSDFVGEKLPMLADRTNDAGISIRVQKIDWNNAFGGGGGGVIMAPMPFPVVTTAVTDVEVTNPSVPDDVTNSSLPATTEPASSTEPASTAPGGPSRPNSSDSDDTTDIAAAPATTALSETTVVGQPNGGVVGWVQPKWCNASSSYRVTMTHKDSVGTSQGQFYDEVRDDAMVTLFSSGHAEGKPFKVLVVQVSPNVSGASVQFAGGGTDIAAAQNGFVLLGVTGNMAARFTLTLNVAGVERVIPSTELGQVGDAGWQKGCNPPPPELPEPGSTQPADPAAAEREITERFQLFFDRSVDKADKPDDLLDDYTGVFESVALVDAGGFADAAKTAQHVIDDFVFTSDTEAWFEYTLETSSGTFTGRFGIAHLVDGSWRIARAVVCQDLSLAGAQCVPFVDPIVPPAG